MLISHGLDLEKDNYDSSVVNKNGYTSKSYYNLWIYLFHGPWRYQHGLKKVLVFLLFHRMQDIIKSCALEREREIERESTQFLTA